MKIPLAVITLASISAAEKPWPQANGAGGNASHRETHLAFIRSLPGGLEPLTDFWSPPHQQTSATEVPMDHPCHGSRISPRTGGGRIACYNLRK